MKETQIITKEEVLAIKNQYKIRISHFVINKEDGSLDVNGDVHMTDTNLQKIPLKFGKIYGDFYCHNNKLTTLKNSPYFVAGDFNCYGNNLTSLELGPTDVGGFYSCQENNLTSLKGSPRIINGNFNCFLNKLTSLEDGPLKVNGSYYANNNELISLEGSPYFVTDSFYVSANPILNLIGCPREIGNIFCFDNTVQLHMGNQNCNIKEVIIQLQEKLPKIEKVLPQIIIDNQRHLPIVFRHMRILDMFPFNGEFDESYFKDFILDIEDGFR